jgi:hypothetical protein
MRFGVIKGVRLGETVLPRMADRCAALPSRITRFSEPIGRIRSSWCP